MNLSKYMVKKPIATIQAESQKGELKRTLTAANLVSLGIGCIIGTGIFVLTGTAAANNAGPAIVISFLLAGLACAFAAMCYAELSSMLPVSGSAYSYAYASMGELAAWVMGWLLLLEYGVASATVAVGWSGYVVSFLKSLGIVIPLEYTTATGVKMVEWMGSWKALTEPVMADIASKGVDLVTLPTIVGIFNLPAFIGISAVTTLLVFGVKESATVNNVIVLIKVLVVIMFIAIGVFYINPDNWAPFIPENTGDYKHFGLSGVMYGASIVFFAYIGFEAVSTAAQEAKNPQRDIPIGILGSLAICTILYIMVALVLTGIVKYDQLNTPSPIATAVDMIGLPWFAFLIKIGAIAGLSSVMLVLLYGQTRIFYTMSKDGLLPPVFARVHPKFQTPWINTIFVGVIAGVVAGTTNINALGSLVNLGTLLAFVIICYTVIHLRKKEPNLARPFQVPFPKVTPILGMVFCGILISALWETFVHLIPYFALGAVIYISYGAKHSKLRNSGL